MTDLSRLADLLEQAATALRGADKLLNTIPARKPLAGVDGFEMLSVRLHNALRRASIRTREDLCSHTVDDLRQIRNFGETSLSELEEWMARNDLHLDGEA